VMDSFFNKNDRRASNRFHANTMVQYFIKRHSMRYMDCELVDVSASGIAITISVPASEDIVAGMDVSLEISVTGSLDQLTVTGRINRVQRAERLFVAIKFDVPLAQDVVGRLLA
jgi:hypothetical protein